MFAPDGRTIYVSNGTNNAIAVIRFDPAPEPPAGLPARGMVSCGFGIGRAAANALRGQHQGHRLADGGRKGRRQYPRQDGPGVQHAVEDRRQRVADSAAEGGGLGRAHRHGAGQQPSLWPSGTVCPAARTPRRGPIPERHGEPSVFKHVALHHQGEPHLRPGLRRHDARATAIRNLCIFGEEVTPNQHKLAREFVLLDNFYCSGVLSADGHQWTDEAYVTDYIEKSFGGWPRSYPHDGKRCLAYAGSGFLWDNALAHGKTLRVYGEFVKAQVRWKDPARKGKPGFLIATMITWARPTRSRSAARPRSERWSRIFCPDDPGFHCPSPTSTARTSSLASCGNSSSGARCRT